jgi:hypothetical protein
MKRDAFYGLAAGVALVLAAPLVAQPAGQAPAPVVQSAPTQPTNAAAQGNEQNSQSTPVKQKICKATVIRAGPDQGQVISKCRHTDRLKADGQSPG